MLGSTAHAMLLLVGVPIALVAIIGIHRSVVVATSDKAPNSFDPTGQDVSSFAIRLARAHANCYEFLPFALIVMLVAVATQQTAATDSLAYPFVAARLAQTATHLASTSPTAVMVRFAFFLAQVLITLWWVWQLW